MRANQNSIQGASEAHPWLTLGPPDKAGAGPDNHVKGQRQPTLGQNNAHGTVHCNTCQFLQEAQPHTACTKLPRKCKQILKGWTGMPRIGLHTGLNQAVHLPDLFPLTRN